MLVMRVRWIPRLSPAITTKAVYRITITVLTHDQGHGGQHHYAPRQCLTGFWQTPSCLSAFSSAAGRRVLYKTKVYRRPPERSTVACNCVAPPMRRSTAQERSLSAGSGGAQRSGHLPPHHVLPGSAPDASGTFR